MEIWVGPANILTAERSGPGLAVSLKSCPEKSTLLDGYAIHLRTVITASDGENPAELAASRRKITVQRAVTQKNSKLVPWNLFDVFCVQTLTLIFKERRNC